jgi:UDP-N-acetylglucosamine 2-epimerase (non-hydrolysing)
MKRVAEELKIPVVYPIHPRTEKMMSEFGLKRSDKIMFIKPLGFLEFIQLESHSKMILTDSGGIQEEACILKIPCVTLRDNTERPETVNLGMNVLAGADPEKIVKFAKSMMSKKISWKNPFGDGKSGEKIVKLSSEHFG